MSQPSNSPANFEDYLRELHATVETMRARIQQLENQPSVAPVTPPTPSPLEAQMAALVAQLSQSQIATPRNPAKSERHPDPEPFLGENGDLDRFTSQLYNKLRMNADRYPTEETKVGYAFSRLKGPPAKAMEGFWSKGSTTIYTLDEFVGNLERLYGNPHKKEHAVFEWLRLRQRNRRFTEFLAEFERLANLGGVQGDDRLQPQLELAISDELRNRMITLDVIPSDYLGFRNKCLQIESRLANAASLSTISRSSPAVGPPRATLPRAAPLVQVISSAPSPRPNSSPATGPNAIPVSNRTTTEGGNLMDLSRIRGPLTPEEKQRRRDNNLCLYCAGPGHIARECPNRVSRIAEMELVDDPEANSQSGKV